MSAMPTQTKADKLTELDALFRRIAPIADEMGGASTVARASVLPMSATVDEQRPEVVPKLEVEMPNDFRVEFLPSGPVSDFYVLSVSVRLFERGFLKYSSAVNLSADGWQVGREPLTEDQIRKWLTLSGPPVR
jgi:hypothetical protein